MGFSIVGPFLHVKKYETDLGPITDYPESKWFTTTFMLDPKEGDVSRRTAFIRNNGLSDGVPSFTIISNHCVHLGCPVQPNGPEISKAKTERDAKTGQEIPTIGIRRRAASAARATAASTTPRATAPRARRCARSTATTSRSATAT